MSDSMHSKDYIIGNPGNNPIKLKILKKDLHYKLLFHPDLYFGEAYTDGEIIIENKKLQSFKRDDILARINFASPYIELPKKLTVKQNLEIYEKNR